MILPSSRALQAAGTLAAVSLLGVAWPAAGWAALGGIVALAAGVLVEGFLLPRHAVTGRRRPPGHLSLNEPGAIAEEIQNLCPFPLELRLYQTPPPGMEMTPAVSPALALAPGASGILRFAATASTRGELSLPPAALRVGRARGLAMRQEPWGEPAVLKVFPNRENPRRYALLRQTRALAALGIHQTRRVGLGSEFDHLRAYSPGDDYRRIHWKATARRGIPITQKIRTERGQNLLVAVDASHWMGISLGKLTRLDYAVDAALFLAHVARDAGDRVGLALFTSEVTSFLAPSSKPGQIRRILDLLYRASPQAVHPSYRNLARHLLTRRLGRSIVVVLTEPVDPESAKELVTALSSLRPRHATLHVGLRDPALAAAAEEIPEDLSGLCRRLTARETLEERQERLLHLRRQGVSSLDVLPKEMSVSLVNRYLELKASGAV